MWKTKNKEKKWNKMQPFHQEAEEARQRNNSLTDGFMGEWLEISAMTRK